MPIKPLLFPAAAFCVASMLNLAGCTTPTPEQSSRPAPREAMAWGENQLMIEVARFAADRPAGLAVSSGGRVFVTFPWEADQPGAAVGEVLGTGEPRPYPNATWNQWDGRPGPSALRAIVSAQALTITRDEAGEFLWILDSGNPRKAGVIVAGPKLFKIDLADDSIANVYYFDHQRDFAADSELSDVRVDPVRRVAYLSDAAHGGIYVVDLKRRTTRAVSIQSGKSAGGTQPAKSTATSRVGVAGLELSADREHLYYHARHGRTLYRVPTAALVEPQLGEDQRAAAVQLLGSTGSAMDGMILDAASGDLYLTALDHRAIFVRRAAHGRIERLVADDRLQRPDSIALGQDGYLYLTTACGTAGLGGDPTAEQAPAQGSAGSVMKVSLAYLQQAAVAAERARDAEIALHETQQAARAAQSQVDAARQEALAEAARAAEALAALRSAAEAVTTRQFELAQTQEAAADQLAQQEAAAAQARADLAAAEVEAGRSRLAADVAAEAARVAELRAAEAQAAADQALAASEQADRSDAEARVVAEIHRRALADAAVAWRRAVESRRLADQLQDTAEAQQARATAAADVWQREQAASQPALDAVRQAQALADAAAESVRQAQLAEVHAQQPPAAATELADVPTPTP